MTRFTALPVIAAQNIGAHKWDRVESVARTGVAYCILLTGSIALLVQIFGKQAYELLLPADLSAVNSAVHITQITIWSTVFVGITFVLFAISAANGAVIAPLCILTATFLVVRVPMAEMLQDMWRADELWWSFPISSIFGFVLAWIYYGYRSSWKMRAGAGPHAAY